MANFKVHIGVAFCASTVASLGVYSTGLVSPFESTSLALIGTIGGILPDIDSDNSTSIRLVFSIIASVVSFLLLFSLLPSLGVIISFLIAIVLFGIVRFGLMSLCKSFTTHRGVLHSPAFGLLSALGLAFGMNFFASSLSSLVGLFLFFGFLIHLLLDEIYAVDLQGVRLKKSFGTAFTLFSFNNPLGYIIIYALLALVIMSYPMAHDFELTLSHISWPVILHNLWPSSVVS